MKKIYKKQATTVLEKKKIKRKLNQFSVLKLNEDESTSLDGPITKKEVYSFIKTHVYPA